MKAKRVRKPRMRPRELIGIVLHRGISPGTGHPYAVIATLESRNRTTGNMVTVWIVRSDVNPSRAEPATRGECGCPGSDEQGNRLQCITCMICDGADRPAGHRQRASVVVVRHANAVATKTLRKNLRTGKVSFE